MSDAKRDYDTCLACGDDVTVTKRGVLRVHGPRNKHCRGSGSYGQFTQRGWVLDAAASKRRRR